MLLGVILWLLISTGSLWLIRKAGSRCEPNQPKAT